MTTFIIGLAVGAGLIAIYAFFRAGFRVDTGTAATLTVFGRFVRDSDGKVRTFGPGLHWKAPWARAIHVSLAERSLAASPASDKHKHIEALASDGTRIRVNARLRYRVTEDGVARFIADAKDAVEHLTGLFHVTVREQVARFEQAPSELSAYTSLRLRMQDLQQRIQDAMKQAALAEYGICVVSVDLLQIDPPEELVDALNAVITSESEARALVSRTELQAQQRLLAAEQAVAIANARALATESEIRTVGTELATLADQGVLRDYVARRQLEVLGESQRVYLNHTTTLRS
jgi:regulator of protease activity HflC (stomatin/prohibitin superfamily)